MKKFMVMALQLAIKKIKMSIEKISPQRFKYIHIKVFEDIKNELFLIDKGLSIMVSKTMA